MEIFRTIAEMFCLIFMGLIMGMLVGQKMEEKNSVKRNDVSYKHAKEVLNYAIDSNRQWRNSFEGMNSEWLEKYTSLHNEYTEMREHCAKNCGGCPKIGADKNE